MVKSRDVLENKWTPPPAGLILLVGGDPFLRSQALGLLGNPPPIELAKADLEQVGARLLAGDIFATAPTLALVDSTGKVLGSKSFQDWMLPRLKRLPRRLRLVLAGPTLQARTRLSKWASKEGVIVDCEPPKPDAVVRWTAARLRETVGSHVSKEVAAGLAERMEHSLTAIHTAAEQLALYAGPGSVPTKNDLEQLFGGASSGTVWEFIDATLSSNTHKALEKLGVMFQQAEHPYKLTPMVASRLQQVWAAATGGKVNAAPWQRTEIQRMAGSIGAEGCRQILADLARVDNKHGVVDVHRALELAVLRITTRLSRPKAPLKRRASPKTAKPSHTPTRAPSHTPSAGRVVEAPAQTGPVPDQRQEWVPRRYRDYDEEGRDDHLGGDRPASRTQEFAPRRRDAHLAPPREEQPLGPVILDTDDGEGGVSELVVREVTSIAFHSGIPATAWMSNFSPHTVTTPSWVDPTRDIKWPTLEHAYQAAKQTTIQWEEVVRATPSPKEVKRIANDLHLPEPVKRAVMRYLLQAKFHQHVMLGAKLRQTGTATLIHVTPWGDAYWGSTGPDGAPGQNVLGELLMEVRALIPRGGKVPAPGGPPSLTPPPNPEADSTTPLSLFD